MIFHLQVHDIFIRKVKLERLIFINWLMRQVIGKNASLTASWAQYLMSYSDNSIGHREILPVKAGFSKTYLIGSILEINQVVLLIMYWRRRFEAQAKAQHVFSSME